MYEWAIIDDSKTSYLTAKKVKAVHPTAIEPVHITKVTATDNHKGTIRLLIYTNIKVKIEECLDRGCVHLVEDQKK